ncbi:MAG: SDR family NAD(P)-dependent oxidoreductase [Planctomycetota bacterium]
MAETDIAVVGMGCRLPGAQNLGAFWRMLRDGRDARRELSDEHLRSVGVPDEVLQDPDFVRAAMVLDGIDQFDAGFFGFSPRDAALFDPQHRLWLEVCWEAFEHAGHVPDRFDGRVGVFAGCGMDTYLLHNVLSNPDLVRQIGMFLIRHTGNDKDFLATRTSYQFDLRGPSVNVVTACSTSLVAVHQAAQSLLNGECDMALAGGVTVLVPQDRGYLYKEGEVLSSDGYCRAFDSRSKGTIFGSGAGVVVLRRLQDALDDGDTIHAVVSGTAVNNDGARKVSFLAPSVDGYAEVVAEALALADVPAERVQYVEAHGTGTSVGDPIEIEALTQAFRAASPAGADPADSAASVPSGFCGIGSVKTNIGHLDTAAGVAGLLKVVLSMQNGELPASLHYEKPNPLIDFERSPFRVVADRAEWPRPVDGPRTAGVSSLGVGGTNAHAIVREATEQPQAPTQVYPRRCHLLPISGKAQQAATDNAVRLAQHFEDQQAEDDRTGPARAELADVSWTMQHGRRAFLHRTFAVGADEAELAQSLRSDETSQQVKKAPERAPSVVFLFPGGGAQYPGMAKELYEFEPAFRVAADACLAALPDSARTRVYELLFGIAAHADADRSVEMERPSLLLPTLFVVEYALAQTLRSFGIKPDAMLGHSLGEYVAATLGGTWTLDQVLPVLVLRGECMEQSEAGAVLSVSLPAAQVQAFGDGELSLSAANAPELSAVAGSPVAIERLEQTLREQQVDCQRLRIGVGAHSHLLDSVLDRFRDGLRQFSPQPATTRWVSNVTGDWIEPERAADVEYWVEHLRRTVRFEDGVATLLDGGDRVFIEVGPGKALTSLVRMHERARGSSALVTVPHPQDVKPADSFLLQSLGQMWQRGVEIDWQAFHGGVRRRRVPLPTYAFQRQRHWIEPGTSTGYDGIGAEDDQPQAPKRLPESEWLQTASFKPRELPTQIQAMAGAHWLVVGGEGPVDILVDALADELVKDGTADGAGAGQLTWFVDSEQEREEQDRTRLPFDDVEAWGRALAATVERSGVPDRILFAHALTEDDATRLVHTLVAMFQAFGRVQPDGGQRVLALTQGAAAVADEPLRRPWQGAVAGFLRVVPREFLCVSTTCVDADPTADVDMLARRLRREIERDLQTLGVAIRDGVRYVQELQAVESRELIETPWRERGVYLITGGLGGIGMLLAEHLAQTRHAKLVLVSRRGLPPRTTWDEWVALRQGDRNADLIQRIRAMERLGAEVEVQAADVADRDAMRAVVAASRDRFGELHGVVHTAGVLDDGLIQTRDLERTTRILRPKVLGAQVLDEVTADAALEVFVVFGSTSSLAGIPGQCDYAAANAALDSFAIWRNRARAGQTLAIDWGIWQDAGMLVDGLDVERQVPEWLGARGEHNGATEFVAAWSPATHWMLAEHRIKDGDCVMPGTGHIELMTTAVQAVANRAQVTLHDVEFRTPLAFVGDRPRDVVVSVRAVRDGFDVTVASGEAGHASEHERATHALARARIAPVVDADMPLDVDVCSETAGPEVAPASDQSRHVAFGPRWQCIESVRVGDDCVLARLQLPDAFVEDLEEYRAHAAMLDMAFGSGIRLLSGDRPDALFVPVGCDRVVVHGRLPAEILSHVELNGYDARTGIGTLDVTVMTPQGVALVRMEGLCLYGVRGAFAGRVGNEDRGEGAVAADLPLSASGDAKTLAISGASAGTPTAALPPSRIATILPRGITAREGMQGLERALLAGAPRVVLSPLDVRRTAEWLSLPPDTGRSRSFGESSSADSGASEQPRDDLERSLAAAFADLLGVEDPDIDEDFFELGGHSLLAVRLFARIHSEFGLDLGLSNLLSAGSVRRLAAVVRGELGMPEPGDQPARSVAAHKGQHVVPIQTEGTRPTLFLVHGAGGNVLGFRDLAHYFGKDQPVFGLQARGVDGKQAPHTTIAEMAQAYLAEIREVQPRGPYYFGGYSGGGVIAYEMAQLLRAVGEHVAFVGMIDSWCPQMPQRGKVARVLLHVGRMIRKGPGYPLGILKMKLQRRSAARDSEKAREQGGTVPQDKRGFEVQFAFERAFVQHRVQRYEGRVWLFRAADQQLGTRYIIDDRLGWGPFVAQGVEVQECPGNHFTMCTEPNVQVLCRYMMAAMDEVMAEVDSSV